MELAFFIITAIGLIITPGPNILVIISTSVSYGKLHGLKTVAGTSIAMMIQLLIAALGTTWFVANLASGFYWLKWAGVVYLIFLGIKHFIAAIKNKKSKPKKAIKSFQRGFWVSLTNPKTIIFFSAFLPQFTVSSELYMTQITQLSLIFLLLAIVLDSTYVLLANKIASKLQSKRSSFIDYFSGSLYLGAGTMLAIISPEKLN